MLEQESSLGWFSLGDLLLSRAHTQLGWKLGLLRAGTMANTVA